MRIGHTDVQGGFWIDMIKVAGTVSKKKKRRDNIRVRIQHPLWGTTVAVSDRSKGREKATES